ncbi:hypothetical protein CHR62_01240 [Pusillimonas sp. NJUB218]|nr:hypothetical protein CHR62_01240 [Pusillimonas sp. NJUB218]
MSASAQQTINLTIASSHPTTFPPVGMMQNFFKPEVDRLLKEGGNKYQIRWKEAYGGTLYKLTDTMEAVRDGITDIGYVGTLWEADTMPLSNLTFFTPFSTDDMTMQATLMDKLVRENAAVRKEWEGNNVKYLGPIVTESYDLWTTKPVGSFADLNGRRINAPGSAARWLQGTGAVAVDGGFPTYYTNIQTGVTEGAVSYFTGIQSVRVYEVAKHVTEVGIGSMFLGGVGMSLDRFNKLPKEVQEALSAAGKAYGDKLIEENKKRNAEARKLMTDDGSTIVKMAPEERQKWVDAMPNIAKEWAADLKAKGIDADKVLANYMDALRASGQKPARNWDQ